ncbi:hypothetical protein EDB81DRAFT_657319 [Dactylonectria macrodidyma]|uniref:Xylanolytic transcriptional activator regulatory domain-containing protein n=1 Tax=Dactylonectria macrodidyma TaxID=307937 RepID=A0A9P9EFS2_9HYPO|nr:hypothetical protein EDB81DRAFT_657319 [Dactylonectria macrodidyma]
MPDPVLLPLPLGTVGIAHFLPEAVFHAVIDDFLFRVYPLTPFIHIPQFKAQLAERSFETNPAFFRLCVALCAVTVASLPRNFATNGSGGWRNAVDMVERASQLITCSYMATMPSWQDEPSAERLKVSLLQGIAFVYVGRTKTGYLYLNEAVPCCRDLELHRRQSYQTLNPVEIELQKRLFWLLLISQCHDRMDDLVPRSGLSYYPCRTDWEFLLLREVSDEELSGDSSHSAGSTPIISGFIALVKLYLSVLDHLEEFFPGASAIHVLSPGGVASRVLPCIRTNTNQVQVQSVFPMLDSLQQVIQKLNTVVDELPEPLTLSRNSERIPDPDVATAQLDHQFQTMSANIHMTAIYLQSTMLEICLGRWRKCYQQNKEEKGTPFALIEESISNHLWSIKAALAERLLHFLECLSGPELESNGQSMIVKIRQVASTFLDEESDFRESGASFVNNFSYQCLDKVISVLTKIDFLGI